MPVYAMKVVDKQPHERTETLFIYQLESPALGRKQVVANLTNVYEVGDVVAIALIGTWLPGVQLKPRKVFGYDSAGMALGVVDAALDTDLSAQFDADRAPRTFTVTYTIEIEARYAEDAAVAASKAIGKGKGTLVSAE